MSKRHGRIDGQGSTLWNKLNRNGGKEIGEEREKGRWWRQKSLGRSKETDSSSRE